MTQHQANSEAMHDATSEFLNQHKDLWEDKPTVVEGVEDFEATRQLIKQRGLAQQTNDTKGYTDQKDDGLQLAMDLTLKAIKKARPYAKKTNNLILLDAVKYTSISQLAKGAQKDAVLRLKAVVDALRPHEKALVPYGFTTTTLPAVEDAINKVEPMTAERDVTGSDRTDATSSLKKLFTQSVADLDNLDDLLEGQVDDANFISNYFIVRRIYDRRGGGGSTKTDEPKSDN